ncbi:MFS transporter [Rhodococcus sp. 14-2470-1b]|uniref:MFS transporter n=1 Tax=unclassified Rhodococcus (in: high G+C Gram-positive bacteria) TaxID=192944 RepID=UPI001C3C7FEC|nr:MFS transporter [Rhodococcus sp. 14-2470-1b]
MTVASTGKSEATPPRASDQTSPAAQAAQQAIQAADQGKATPQAKRAAAASFLGSMLEYYDFFIYGSAAALIFPALFFPTGNPAVATIAALATFGVGYVARPLGGIVLGHFGDRLGRKRVLLFTLVLMGVASTSIGLLPTYQQIGAWAPALLVLARVLQGFSAGGEAAGASTLTIEHAPTGRRGLFASFTVSGIMAGIVVANLVFIPVAVMPDETLMSWGWRVPFLASSLVLVLAYVVRKRLDETPVFVEAKEKDATPDIPFKTLMKTQWADVVRVAMASLFAVNQTVVMVFGLAYATSEAGMARSTMLWVLVAAHAASVVGVPLAAGLSDRIGRRPVWIFGAISSSSMLFVFFWAISTGNILFVTVSGIVLVGGAYSCMNGLWPATFSEQFAAPVRYSGFALGHGTGLLVAAFAPTICVAIMGEGQYGWLPVGIFVAITGAVSATGIYFCKETNKTPLAELGHKGTRAAA